MLYMCYGVDGPNGAELRELAREEHFLYLESNSNVFSIIFKLFVIKLIEDCIFFIYFDPPTSKAKKKT